MSSDFLYYNEGSIEFWTRKSDGQSAVSVRGLARMCGKRLYTVQFLLENLENNPTNLRASKPLEPFLGKDLNLGGFPKKKGGSSRAIKADVTTSIIAHYAFKGSKVAQNSLRAFTSIGITSYIQGRTGWLPEAYQASPEARQTVSRILEELRPWEAVYSDEFLSWVRSNYNSRYFFWKYIYNSLTPQEREGLKQVNPGKVHTLQYLNQETLDRLEPQVQIVYALANTSTSAQDFETRYCRHFGYNQLEMFPEF